MNATPTAFLVDGPYTTFVPLKKVVQVEVGDELILKSYHVSNAKLARLDILVNGQQLRTEATGTANTFPPELATVQVLSNGQPVVAGAISPELGTSAWTVYLRWVGHVPGSYELTLQATDEAGRTSEPVTQRIEVR